MLNKELLSQVKKDLLMRRRRRLRISATKDAIKKSTTLVANIGQGTANPTAFSIASTDVGARLLAGSTQVIMDDQTTGSIVNVGNVIKYLNICIQVANREITGEVATPSDNGWLEYALIIQQENYQAMTGTNLGVQTLGDTANKQYRRNCVFTGCIPVGAIQPITQDIKIKIPPKFQKFQVGGTITLFVHFRSNRTTDVRTDSTRVILSSIYKTYV